MRGVSAFQHLADEATCLTGGLRIRREVAVLLHDSAIPGSRGFHTCRGVMNQMSDTKATSSATVAAGWEVHRRGPRLVVPEPRVAAAVDRARAQLQLAHDGRAVRRDGHRTAVETYEVLFDTAPA